ncbi:heavy metal translocating P-type ATPase [Zobellia galactanivorans]|uniref:heavy metal translocating P-type ATPase n=1 Tax=Zobellia galactanivorans (strain DSM 12802 / CCUG 47099 / CIP 106680 / NCIMB 13871 / Dsij) TaxID=63186 RepID=UPI0026E3D7F8|nr:heavy metal translocating P-type ATPase [Zobellia galactanivorans]MDO6809486.1 heavy metal translocating P-type ATPase [Zobellia galactanivorans]
MKKKKIVLRDTGAHEHSAGDGHDHGGSCCDSQKNAKSSRIKQYTPAIISFVLLMSGILLDFLNVGFFKDWLRIVWYVAAYIPVGFPVMKQGWESILKGDFFTEFFLMSIATVGAFAIGEFPEGVAVMLFYTVGELFQHSAVTKARGNIKALLDVRPKSATVLRDGNPVSVAPESVKIGERIQVRVGEKVPLDGKLVSQKASLNTAAISGESKPSTILHGDKVYAGSINLDGVVEIVTTKEFKDSSIARILDMVQNATARKSKTELFIRKFAKIYTPIVVFLAIGLTLFPYFFVQDYIFSEWLYRALIFLVISCPCALVISIPLGYFGGLGAASRNGILFKGASFLDTITKINTLAMDKTGTMTKGVFKIKDIVVYSEDGSTNAPLTEQDFMHYLMAIEAQSTHPIAKAILDYKNDGEGHKAQDVFEVAGKGLIGTVDRKSVLAGNEALMLVNGIVVPEAARAVVESTVMVAIEGKFAGYVVIADELKEGAMEAVESIRKMGISKIVMLSGDKEAITQKVAGELHVDSAMGGLLPEDKLKEVERLKGVAGAKVAFIGDGINDAPVLAASNLGIAMGGLGSDVAIETADVIIQTDQPEKVVQAIAIGRSTRRIVWQNIGLAFGVKAIVLILGAGGVATMWEAVFADVGVALLAVLNAVRLQNMKWQ